MTVGERHHLGVHRGRERLKLEVLPGPVGGQVPQRDNPQQVPPARVGQPVRRRGLAAGDDNHNPGRQGGQEAVTHPPL
jgi:hypothetical protein